MKTNLLNLLVSYLEKRGRIVRAGGDNLPKHLSVVLDNGPQHNALRELLLSQPVELDVQLDGYRITSVSLAAWAAAEEDREVDQVPEDNDAMWAFSLSAINDEKVRLEAALVTAQADLEVAIELLRDQPSVSQECEKPHTDDRELMALLEENASLKQRNEMLEATNQQIRERYAELAKEHRHLQTHVCATPRPEEIENGAVELLIRAIDEGRLSIIQLDGPHRTT